MFGGLVGPCCAAAKRPRVAASAGPSLIFQDKFDEGSNTSLDVHTPDLNPVGGGWNLFASVAARVAGGGGYAVKTNHDGGQVDLMSIDLGTANVRWEVDCQTGGVDLWAGAGGWVDSFSDWFLARTYGGTNTFSLYKFVGGVLQPVLDEIPFVPAPASNYTITMSRTAGNVITASITGGSRDLTVTDAFNATKTKFGLAPLFTADRFLEARGYA